jgi:hypothetical protein
MCKQDKCRKQPVYNKEDEKTALYCKQHKTDGMIDVKNKTCKEVGCKIRPCYNKEGEKTALYCNKHKTDNMIDVISKTCKEDGCKKKPNYNFDGEKKSLYCNQHKKDGMIDVKNKTCKEDDCKIRASYNKEGEKIALYCKQHKTDGMIDVIHKTCKEDSCRKQPVYNKEGEKIALYCKQHKTDDMIDVKSKTCKIIGCKIRPSYNKEGEKIALYCNQHKKDGMIDVIHKTCKTYLCNTLISKKYDGYCLYCFINLFPDKPVSRNYKTKECSVVEFIKNKFQEYHWISDKTIKDGCSRRRPDLLLDLGFQIIIIEIDENQHTDYGSSCENKRIMELSQDVGHRPIIFIRFNPDDYTNNNVNITSCWGQNNKAICVLKKSKEIEWFERLKFLENQINYWVNNKTDKTIEVIQLFYDI